MGYLDQTGLTHFWTKIKAALNRKQDRLIPDETILIKDGGISVKGGVRWAVRGGEAGGGGVSGRRAAVDARTALHSGV